MSLNNPPPPGAASVSEYQVSGVPFFFTAGVPNNGWLSQSFPFVTRDVTVRNLGGSGNIQIGVTQSGSAGLSGNNFFALPFGQAVTLNVRTTQLWIYNPGGGVSITASVCAGMTTIPQYNFPILSASIGFTGVG